MSDLADIIRANAAKPMKASGDTGSVEQFPLKDLLAADRYLTDAAAKKNRGLRFAKMRSPGAP